jgi:hypothetical protein
MTCNLPNQSVKKDNCQNGLKPSDNYSKRKNARLFKKDLPGIFNFFGESPPKGGSPKKLCKLFSIF